MRIKLAIATIIVAVFSVGASAQSVTGKSLLLTCRAFVANEKTGPPADSSDALRAGMCLGYMNGFMASDGLVISEGNKPFNLVFVESVTAAQIAHAFVSYMLKHPEEETHPAAHCVTNAAMNANLLHVVPRPPFSN